MELQEMYNNDQYTNIGGIMVKKCKSVHAILLKTMEMNQKWRSLNGITQQKFSKRYSKFQTVSEFLIDGLIQTIRPKHQQDFVIFDAGYNQILFKSHFLSSEEWYWEEIMRFNNIDTIDYDHVFLKVKDIK